MKEEITEGVRDTLKWNLVGISGKALIDALSSTCRIRHIDPYGAREITRTRRFICAFWHSRILVISYLYKNYDGAIMVSQHEDGEIIAQVIARQGHRPVRGSTTRGGSQAMARIEEKLGERARPGVMIPDGPQGPRRKAQPGVIALARKTGYPIVPFSYSARDIWVLRSWDRFIIPKPFTEAVMMYGRPFKVPEDIGPEQGEEYRRLLEDDLNRITDQADSLYRHDPAWHDG